MSTMLHFELLSVFQICHVSLCRAVYAIIAISVVGQCSSSPDIAQHHRQAGFVSWTSGCFSRGCKSRERCDSKQSRAPLLSMKSILSENFDGKTKVAVVGGGLAGLAVSYHLLNMTKGKDSIEITIMDEFDIGEGGASGAMAGILHPLTPRGKEIWMGNSGMVASLRLIEAASQYSERPLISAWSKGRGVIRLVTTEKQQKDYQTSASTLSQMVEMVRIKDLDYLQGLSESITYGLSVKGGCAVRGSDYTRALLKACQDLGSVTWKRRRVESIASVVDEGYDSIVVAAGAACKHIAELKDTLPVKGVRSQNIEFVRRPGSERRGGQLGVPVISGIYLVPFEGPDGEVYLCGGATQEHDSDTFTREPDLAMAMAELEEPLSKVYPPINGGDWIPSRARAGVKCLPNRQAEGSIPYVGRIHNLTSHTSCWLFTGLGARGLIHHSVLGELLATAIIQQDEDALPALTRRIDQLSTQNDGV